MPYRLSEDGLCVQKNKDGKWTNLKCYPDHKKALAYLGALEANVKKAEAFLADPEVRHQIREITKVDESEHLVFGWFNVAVTADGKLLKDLHNDMIEPEVLEKAAYDFVLDSRVGGAMHAGPANAVLVESMVFTPEKITAMEQQAPDVVKIQVPPGWWWGGFKVNDQETFAKVVSGEYSMFSIEGTAVRLEVEDAAA